jgi:hypothetical protein
MDPVHVGPLGPLAPKWWGIKCFPREVMHDELTCADITKFIPIAILIVWVRPLVVLVEFFFILWDKHIFIALRNTMQTRYQSLQKEPCLKGNWVSDQPYVIELTIYQELFPKYNRLMTCQSLSPDVNVPNLVAYHNCIPINFKWYSLRPKMIVLSLIFLGLKMIVQFICPDINLTLKVKYFGAKLLSSRSLLTPQLHGAFRSSWCFSILRAILATTRSMANGS